MPIGIWTEVFTPSGFSYLNICGQDCMISLCHEPTNNNRGPYHACLEVFNLQQLPIEDRDGWSQGRYYFDLERAKAEIEAWLAAWNQL